MKTTSPIEGEKRGIMKLEVDEEEKESNGKTEDEEGQDAEGAAYCQWCLYGKDGRVLCYMGK